MNFDFLAISWQELSKCKQSVVKFSSENSLPDLKFLTRVFCGVIGELADLEAGFKLNSRSICTNSTWRTISTKASNKCLSSWWFFDNLVRPLCCFYYVSGCFVCFGERGRRAQKRKSLGVFSPLNFYHNWPTGGIVLLHWNISTTTYMEKKTPKKYTVF